MPLSAVIVDDEQLARDELAYLLKNVGDVNVVAQGKNGLEAISLIKEHNPDLVFLDVQMPGLDGFGVIKKLLDKKVPLPKIVFATAFDQYAVKAFEVNAVDYLLKPIEPERLAAALDKLQATPLGARRDAHKDSPLEQLFVRDGPRCWFIPLRDVSVFSAEGNYVRMQWGQERPLLGRSLAALESKLDPQRFFRANRQQIINLEFIRSVDLGVGGRLHVQLNDGREVQISRRQARQFRERTTV